MPRKRGTFYKRLRTLNLTGTQATGANINTLVRSFNYSLHLADVGLPGSVALTVGVGYGVTKGDTLTANTALCHGNLPPNRLHAVACATYFFNQQEVL